MIPLDEWLHLAKKVAIGSSKRVYHKHETTPAMTVKNLPDRYTAYCHRCHEGAVHLKEHAALSPINVQAKFMPWPDDAVLFANAAVWEQMKVFEFLVTKGIDYSTMLKDVPMYLSNKHGRLIIGTGQGWIGRALRGQVPKWATYGKPAVFGIGVAESISKRVVLVEDYLSKIKGQWAVPEVTWIACLGTRPHQKLIAAMIAAGVESIGIMFDGDKAGNSGYAEAAKRLKGLGFKVDRIDTPSNCDPKDLTHEQLRRLVCCV